MATPKPESKDPAGDARVEAYFGGSGEQNRPAPSGRPQGK